MKKLILLLFSFFIFTTSLAQKITFPDCFKFDQSIFTGMVLAKINDEMRKEQIFENPAIVTDEMGIRRMAERMILKISPKFTLKFTPTLEEGVMQELWFMNLIQ